MRTILEGPRVLSHNVGDDKDEMSLTQRHAAPGHAVLDRQK